LGSVSRVSFPSQHLFFFFIVWTPPPSQASRPGFMAAPLFFARGFLSARWAVFPRFHLFPLFLLYFGCSSPFSCDAPQRNLLFWFCGVCLKSISSPACLDSPRPVLFYFFFQWRTFGFFPFGLYPYPKNLSLVPFSWPPKATFFPRRLRAAAVPFQAAFFFLAPEFLLTFLSDPTRLIFSFLFPSGVLVVAGSLDFWFRSTLSLFFETKIYSQTLCVVAHPSRPCFLPSLSDGPQSLPS